MKIPVELLADSDKGWDRWQAFHWGVDPHGRIKSTRDSHSGFPFIIFDTGEVVCTTSAPDPDWRREYPLLGVRLVSTADKHLPQLTTAEGRSVPKAWLNECGMQYLLIDYETRRVVALQNETAAIMAARIPRRFCYTLSHHYRTDKPPTLNPRISVWFPGEGYPPVGHRVMVDVPITNKEWLTDAQREHIATITDTCRMALHLQGFTKKESAHLSASRLLEVASYDQLSRAEQLIVANGKIMRPRFRQDYLLCAS